MKSTPLAFVMRTRPIAVSNKFFPFFVISSNNILSFCFWSFSLVLKCDPYLSGTKELVNELNKSNGLFKFVRTMREKFQQAAAQGTTSFYLSLMLCIGI